jgi:tRNA-5-taurinomethyluridine 2-sulfurtransferase
MAEQTIENGDVLVVHLSEDDQGLAAGQFAAFYRENVCLGSGIILDSWGKMSFPVCSRALDIARLEDKSSLGKPVRIMNLEHITKSEQAATKVA